MDNSYFGLFVCCFENSINVIAFTTTKTGSVPNICHFNHNTPEYFTNNVGVWMKK